MAFEIRELEFEEALKRLSEIVRELESGGLKLEEALHKFEEGVELANFCSKKLSEAELTVKQLVEQKGKVELLDWKP
ncbi:MAG: exodeoxyribonuclease VII small subunit [Methanocellales archaeon]